MRKPLEEERAIENVYAEKAFFLFVGVVLYLFAVVCRRYNRQ